MSDSSDSAYKPARIAVMPSSPRVYCAPGDQLAAQLERPPQDGWEWRPVELPSFLELEEVKEHQRAAEVESEREAGGKPVDVTLLLRATAPGEGRVAFELRENGSVRDQASVGVLVNERYAIRD